jgi:hypothetical protein
MLINLYIKNIIIILFFSFALVSCATVTDKIPKFERKTCDGSNKTLADITCKKN